MKQLTILTGNQAGILAEIASLLGGHGVNMESITAETFPDGAIIRLITKDSNTASKLLKQAAYNVMESDVLVLEMLDRPGELGKIAKKMASEGVNIENIYLISKKDGKALLALRVSEPERADRLFSDYAAENY